MRAETMAHGSIATVGWPGAVDRADLRRAPTAVRLEHPRRRRGDLLLGALVAVALHGALYCSGWLFPPTRNAPSPTIAEVAAPEPLLTAVELEPPPAPDAPPDLVGYAAAGNDAPSATTNVPLDLLQTQAGTITLQYARFSPTLGGNGAGFRLDGSALRDTGRGIRVAVFELADLDQAPVILSQPLPQYPASLLRSGAAGAVTVVFVVDTDGVVRAPRVLAATKTELAVPALQAVAQWKFRPGRKDGRAVATRVEVPIAFSIPGRG
jgi:protein TonB